MSQDIKNPHDRLFQELWSRPELGRDFLRNYLPAKVLALMDLDSLELVKGSFVEESLRQHRSDLLYRVRLKDGRAAFVYVLLEHKRSAERLTAFQLLRYIVRIADRYLTEHPNADLPPILPLVVYHGDRPWPYGQTLHEALRLPEAFVPYTPSFRYALCDLAGLSDEAIRGQVLLRAVLLLMKHVADPQLAHRLPEIFGLLRALGGQRTVMGYLETLLSYLAVATDTLTDNDVRQAIRAAAPEQEETLMSTLAEQWYEQGQLSGEKRGQATLLVEQLEWRFGPLPERYRQRIQAAEPAALLRWARRVLTVQRLEEVFDDPGD